MINEQDKIFILFITTISNVYVDKYFNILLNIIIILFD